MFSPTLICMCKPNKEFMLLSFSLFISWVCSSYSMKGSRLEMAVAFTSPWAFFFRRHSLEDKERGYELTLFNMCDCAEEAVNCEVFHLAWMRQPFPVTAASGGRLIVVNSTSGTFKKEQEEEKNSHKTTSTHWTTTYMCHMLGICDLSKQNICETFCRLQR